MCGWGAGGREWSRAGRGMGRQEACLGASGEEGGCQGSTLAGQEGFFASGGGVGRGIGQQPQISLGGS
jgi:hypothetical protein